MHDENWTHKENIAQTDIEDSSSNSVKAVMLMSVTTSDGSSYGCM